MPEIPEQFAGVTVLTKANVYFDGNVVSHALEFADGAKKTLGLIYPGEYHFGTKAAERMQIVSGNCEVVLDGQTAKSVFGQGDAFDVPANSGFTIAVEGGVCEYICSFVT